ncbi:MAG: hypothetical protein IT328_04395 [Caldilineaceae bacterium]|nr:hypothetical protein [Caldilineaceae bacterium]
MQRGCLGGMRGKRQPGQRLMRAVARGLRLLFFLAFFSALILASVWLVESVGAQGLDPMPRLVIEHRLPYVSTGVSP